ncbi:MAG: hypothetical protein HY773_01585 [Candidatus Terrybacteria bacterium]|nr:hypothetical protein [Candidatus Terrybacteria bacterium]
MNKKAIIILIAVAAILLIIGGIYWYYSGKPAGERPGIISALFPFGEEEELGLPIPPEGLPPPPVSEVKVLELIQLTKNAISGAGAASTTIRYIERSTGHIYEIEPNGRNRKRLSNITILKTFESFWSAKADKVILRYFETDQTYLSVKTFSATLPLQGATTTAISGMFLPQSIMAVAISPEEDKIFYLDATEKGATGPPAGWAGMVTDFENKKQTKIFSTPFGGFNASWPSKNIIALLTKPSAVASGFFYSLNAKTGEFKRILGDIKGLTALMSPDAERVIYSQSADRILETKVFNLKSKETTIFSLTTLPEKCVWSKTDPAVIYCSVPEILASADYPDEWYQGLISFNDSIWQNNLSIGETILLKSAAGLDVINPFLTRDENYFVFTDKNDNTLWSLRLK